MRADKQSQSCINPGGDSDSEKTQCRNCALFSKSQSCINPGGDSDRLMKCLPMARMWCRNPVLTQAVILTSYWFWQPPQWLLKCRNPVLTQAVILTFVGGHASWLDIPCRNPVLTQAVILTEYYVSTNQGWIFKSQSCINPGGDSDGPLFSPLKNRNLKRVKR